MRVLSQLGPKTARRIAERFPDVDVVDVSLDEAAIGDDVRGDVLFTWGFGDLASLVRRTGVSWVHLAGTGVDRIPLDALTEVTVTCNRGVSGVPIAEFVLACVLAFEKRVPDVWIDEPVEPWHDYLRLGEVAGKTMGLVGLGGIGAEVARRALAFDMRVVALRRTEQPSPVPGVELAATLDDLLAAVDHLVVTAPLTDATRSLIDDRALSLVKPGVHLVNVSRGGIVDQDALVRALDDGRVATASLDVVTPEPLPAGHPLYAHPKVRLSPHLSWSSPHSTERRNEAFMANLARHLAGEPLEGVVTEDGY